MRRGAHEYVCAATCCYGAKAARSGSSMTAARAYVYTLYRVLYAARALMRRVVTYSAAAQPARQRQCCAYDTGIRQEAARNSARTQALYMAMLQRVMYMAVGKGERVQRGAAACKRRSMRGNQRHMRCARCQRRVTRMQCAVQQFYALCCYRQQRHMIAGKVWQKGMVWQKVQAWQKRHALLPK